MLNRLVLLISIRTLEVFNWHSYLKNKVVCYSSPVTNVPIAFPPISSIVLPVPYAKKYTSVKRAADWVIVSANTLGMLRLTIKTLLNQSRDISTSLTILKNTWRFVVFPSI